MTAPLAAWLVFSLGLVVLSTAAPRVAVATIIGLLVAVPPELSNSLLGQNYTGSSSLPVLNPVAWPLMASTMAFLLAGRGDWMKTSWTFIAAFAVTVTWCLSTTLLGASGGGFALLADTVVAPILGYIWLRIMATEGIIQASYLRSVVRALLLLQVLLAVAQRLTERTIVFETYYESTRWFQYMALSGEFRSPGSLDHPLNLALFCLLAGGVATWRSSRFMSTFFSLVSFTGILTTGSRAGAIVGVLSLLLVVGQWRGAASRKVLGILSVGVAVYLAVSSQLGSGLASRFADDLGSTEARFSALNTASQVLTEYWLFGDGMGSADAYARGLGLKTSFENPLLILAVQVGLFGVALMLWLVLAALRDVWQGSAWLAGLACLMLLHVLTYSSISVKSTAVYLFWLGLAIYAVLAERSIDAGSTMSEVDNRAILGGHR